jgi:hypothetical protein
MLLALAAFRGNLMLPGSTNRENRDGTLFLEERRPLRKHHRKYDFLCGTPLEHGPFCEAWLLCLIREALRAEIAIIGELKDVPGKSPFGESKRSSPDWRKSRSFWQRTIPLE